MYTNKYIQYECYRLLYTVAKEFVKSLYDGASGPVKLSMLTWSTVYSDI